MDESALLGPLPGARRDTRAPEERASWISRLGFLWFAPMARIATRRLFAEADLPNLPAWLEPARARAAFWKSYAAGAARSRDGRGGVWTAIAAAFWPTIVAQMAYGLLFAAASVARPLLLHDVLYELAACVVRPADDRDACTRSTVVQASVLAVVVVIYSWALNWFWWHGVKVTVGVESALTTSLFRRTLERAMRPRWGAWEGGPELDDGALVSRMSVDATAVTRTFILNMLHWGTWIAVLTFALAMVFLFRLVGLAAVGGPTVMAVPFPVAFLLVRWRKRLKHKASSARDRRASAITASLGHMRFLRVALQEPWAWAAMLGTRVQEQRRLWQAAAVNAFTTVLETAGPTLVPVVVFLAYVRLHPDSPLTASIAFSATVWFTSLSGVFSLLPGVIRSLVNVQVSVDRLSTVLALPAAGSTRKSDARRAWASVEPVRRRGDRHAGATWDGVAAAAVDAAAESGFGTGSGAGAGQEASLHSSGEPLPAGVVAVRGVSFAAPDRDAGLLHRIALQLPRGALCAVIGPVGGGKSALLAALAGQLRGLSGEARTTDRGGGGDGGDGGGGAGHTGDGSDGDDDVGDCDARPRSYSVELVGGTVAWVRQSPWLLDRSVRENVAFFSPRLLAGGLPPTADELREAYAACGLDLDLATLPQGDRTLVGSKGVKLSGGQRSRICLAQALVSQSDVVLLDDVLSGCDAGVARHIFHRCIVGAMRGATRVLATHNLVLAGSSHVTHVVVVEGGRVVAQAPRLSALATHPTVVRLRAQAELAAQAREAEARERGSATGVAAPTPVSMPTPTPTPTPTPMTSAAALRSSVGANVAGEESKVAPRDTATALSPAPESQGDPSAASARQQTEESRARGGVRVRDLAVYLRGCGGTPVVLALVLFLVAKNASDATGSIVLASWVDELVAAGAGNASAAGASAAGNGTVAPGGLTPHASALQRQYGDLYGLVIGAGLLALLFRSIGVSTGALRAATSLFKQVVSALLAAPLAWHDNTPVGQLLNRLLNDQDALDSTAAPAIVNVATSALNLVQSVFVVAFAAPVLMVGLLLVCLPYVRLARMYLPIAQDMKRVQKRARSPVYSLYSEVVHGRPVLAAYAKGRPELLARLTAEFDALQHRSAASTYYFWAAQQWVTLWLEAIGCLFVAMVLAFCVYAVLYELPPWLAVLATPGPSLGRSRVSGVQNGHLTVGFAGMALTSVLSLPWNIMWVVRRYANLHTELVCLERCVEYARLPSEGDARDADQRRAMFAAAARGTVSAAAAVPPLPPPPLLSPPTAGARRSARARGGKRGKGYALLHVATSVDETAPQVGGATGLVPLPPSASVALEDVRLFYRSDQPPSLRGLTFQVPAGAKVAVIGRTGAGKTSLFMALLRLYEYQGVVKVDGQDLRDLTLFDSRRRCAVIPQDPVLLPGSIRSNLDPGVRVLSEADTIDGAMWAALERVRLADRVRAMPDGLSTAVDDTLFSAGERQLLAVARALLLHAPVSLFDECTSSVDERTDEMVHDAVLALPSTVLSICHRLAHLPRFDLVLVLADGRVAEYGRVADLMADQGSLTSSMYTRYRDLGA